MRRAYLARRVKDVALALDADQSAEVREHDRFTAVVLEDLGPQAHAVVDDGACLEAHTVGSRVAQQGVAVGDDNVSAPTERAVDGRPQPAVRSEVVVPSQRRDV